MAAVAAGSAADTSDDVLRWTAWLYGDGTAWRTLSTAWQWKGSQAVEFLYLPFSTLSALACLTVLWSLFWLRTRLSGHLFFIQLVLLTTVDFMQSLVDAFLAYNGLWKFVDVGDNPCQGLTTFRVWCEFLTCLLEVHIAAGFVVACWGKARAVSALVSTLAACFLLAAGLVLAVQPWTSLGEHCRQHIMPGWGITCFSCCVAALLMYICGAVKVSRAPPLIKRRAWARGLSYSLCFLLSFGPRAIVDFVLLTKGHQGPKFLDSYLATSFLCLNGFFNACAFYFWMWRKRVLSRHCSFSRHCADVDSLMIDTYFDLYLTDAEDRRAFEARQRLATAVGEAVEAREL
eukprot:TRINITY_DN80029_c0_g1_i1.p1 TRINITY_DN80029_c0_g1~~TRINITY_DN80029_c0_g1_i1.p1  ORF type:complete len:345 (+),score=39.68 TRINITY_DN80029_c0_g1_i1:74-1108(+)